MQMATALATSSVEGPEGGVSRGCDLDCTLWRGGEFLAPEPLGLGDGPGCRVWCEVFSSWRLGPLEASLSGEMGASDSEEACSGEG